MSRSVCTSVRTQPAAPGQDSGPVGAHFLFNQPHLSVQLHPEQPDLRLIRPGTTSPSTGPFTAAPTRGFPWLTEDGGRGGGTKILVHAEGKNLTGKGVDMAQLCTQRWEMPPTQPALGSFPPQPSSTVGQKQRCGCQISSWETRSFMRSLVLNPRASTSHHWLTSQHLQLMSHSDGVFLSLALWCIWCHLVVRNRSGHSKARL